MGSKTGVAAQTQPRPSSSVGVGYQGTAILFSPDRTKSVLAYLPTVAALIPDPADEGVESQAFPGVLRKTDRELYRWIANTHYEHLREPVLQLEQVHAAGCTFEQMLKTTSREQFVSLSAEVLVAHDLVRRGYTVETIKRSGGRSPDLRVRGKDVDMAVEVYSPRELRAVDEWVHEVTDLLQYVDVRASFNSNVSTAIQKPIPPGREPPDPWAPDKMLQQTSGTVLAEITSDVDEALRDLRPLDKSYQHPDTPMVTTVTLDDVRPAPEAGPARNGSFSAPGFSGYSPVGVFRKIVERAVKKAHRQQTRTVDARLHALVVYLMGTQIAQDLTHPAYSARAEGVLKGDVDPAEYGLDAIAFVVRALPRGLAYVLAIADDTNITLSQVDALFGQMD